MHDLAVDHVSGITCLELRVLRRLGILVARRGGGSAEDASGRIGRHGEFVRVLAGERDELIAGGALRDGNGMFVAEGLDLAVAPAFEGLVVQDALGGAGFCHDAAGRVLCLLGECLGVQAGDAGVAADGRDQLVAAAGLWGWDAVAVEEGLELGVGPFLVEPVTGVRGRFGEFGCGGGVVGSGGGEELVALAGLWDRDVMVVAERFQLGVRPARSCTSVNWMRTNSKKKVLTYQRSNP